MPLRNIFLSGQSNQSSVSSNPFLQPYIDYKDVQLYHALPFICYSLNLKRTMLQPHTSQHQQNTQGSVKMIDFIKNLYKEYKILNKLGDKQSNDFQKEIITNFVDQFQNVDMGKYQSVLSQIGLQRYLLDTLSNIMNRNPFKNQFELNRNLATITENIKKQQEIINKKTQENIKKQEQLNKRQKAIAGKDQQLKGKQEKLLLTIKNKMIEMQNDLFQRLLKKQTQIKKNVSVLAKQLKNKEVLILNKYELIKNGGKILIEMQQKQKIIHDKMKLLQKKERQSKNKQLHELLLKKNTELEQLKGKLDKMSQQHKQFSRKYKNLQLSYKKMKHQNGQLRMNRQEKLKVVNKQNDFALQNLEISNIFNGNQCQQLLEHINYEQELAQQLSSIKKAFSSNKQGPQLIEKIKQILHLQEEESNKRRQFRRQSSQQDDNSLKGCNFNLKLQKLDDVFMERQSEEMQSEEEIIVYIDKLKSFCESDLTKILKEKALENLIEKCYFHNLKAQLSHNILELMIDLMQDKIHYQLIMQTYSNPLIVKFLEQIYLAHQTHAQIIQTSTLLLSRIKIKNEDMRLSSDLRRALQMRCKVEPRQSFLYGNIKYILQ